MTPKPATPKPTRSSPKAPWKKRQIKALLRQVELLIAELRSREKREEGSIAAAHRDCRASARNLVRSLALAGTDIDELGDDLATCGLTRLHRRQPDALSALHAVRAVLLRLKAGTRPRTEAQESSSVPSPTLVEKRTAGLLGAGTSPGSMRVLVTSRVGTGDASASVRELLDAGVDGLAIDARHGDPTAWGALRSQILQEANPNPPSFWLRLAGPRIETGELTPGPPVLRWEPRRNQLGKLLSPARLWLTAEDQIETPLQPVEVVLPVPRKLLKAVQTEDTLVFRDARGRRRELRIRGAGRSGCLAEGDQTTYVESGATLRLMRRGKLVTKGPVGPLPRPPRPLILNQGDPLILTRDRLPGRPAVREGGFLRSPARISCSMPEALEGVRSGERLAFGDGSITGLVESVNDKELRIRLTRAHPDGSNLVPGVTIRFPDSALDLPALGPGDELAIASAADHADAVILPLVERPEDVLALGRSLDRHGGQRVGLVLGISTRRGVEALPELLMAALRRPSSALCISLGALAVELGSMRLAKAIDEIRWLCRSAQLPVMFSSPDLDRLARQEVSHPAEIRDALPAERYEGLLLADGKNLTEILPCLRRDSCSGSRNR